MTTREQAIEFLKGADLTRMRASKAPAEFRELVRAVHARLWDEDGREVATSQAAIHGAMAELFPVGARPQRKGSEGCARCGGTGHIEAFAHIHGGKCLACE